MNTFSMQEMTKYLDAFTSFAEQAHWILPALGLLFIFLCIVSKGFRNFIIGLIILALLFFVASWFYSHFYRTEEERAEFRKKVVEVFGKEKKNTDVDGKAGKVEIIKRVEKEERIEPVREMPAPTPLPTKTNTPKPSPTTTLVPTKTATPTPPHPLKNRKR